jgi:hypothetical protein
MRTPPRWPAHVVLIFGAALRMALAFVTPPEQAYDDHYEPVRIILKEGRLPSAADCWECYQPPAYYVVSAGLTWTAEHAFGGLASAIGSPEHVCRRILQFVSLVAGCATLWVCRAILRRVNATLGRSHERGVAGRPGPTLISSSDTEGRRYETLNSSSDTEGRRYETLNSSSEPEVRRYETRTSPSGAEVRRYKGTAVGARGRREAWYEALAVAVVALLPCHIYMSAMATNDALTYFVASLAVLAVLRAHAGGWTVRGCVLVGLLAGATVLCKGYGWVTVAAIGLSVWLFTRRPVAVGLSRWRREITLPVGLVVGSALAIGIWPAVRNVWIYDRPFVDNFDLFPETPMRYQPPGSIGQTSFVSFRFLALLRHPWLHVSHVDSLWTELYARLWFDYEGFKTTLPLSPAWEGLWQRCAQAQPLWSRARWEMLLSYGPDEVPADFGRLAVVSYLAGLPLTLGVLAGLVVALRRMRGNFALLVLAAHVILAAAVPVLHELRLPHFAAMKTAFALSGMAAVPVFISLVRTALRGRAVRWVVIATLWICIAGIAVSDVAFVWCYYRDALPA